MKKILLLLSLTFYILNLQAQVHTVSGLVLSADDNTPLIGVNIYVKSSGKGAVTDFDGKFTISVNEGDTLTFSYVGYLPQKRVVTSDENITVKLKPEFQNIDQVYVVGYGTQKKSDITGSVVSVSSDEITQTPVSGIDQALQGRAPGVVVTSNSGQPGSEMTVRIRGIGTVNNSNPLYVVDGVLLDNINFLNPNDIKSIEILKDASAAAIYGSRGANGVVLVTTRKGSTSSKMNTTVDVYTGIQNRWNTLDLMNREQYAAFKGYTAADGNFSDWVYNEFSLSNNPYIPTDINYSNYDTDWQDVVFRKNAKISNYYVSFDGGTDKSTYAMSLGYFDQDGIIIASNYKRFTVRINTSTQATSYLKVGENLSLTNSKSRGVATNNENYSVLNSAISLAPWDPPRYPDGRITPSTTTNLKNPLSMVELENPSDTWNRLVGNVYAEVTPIEDLTFRSSADVDVSYGVGGNFKPAYYISQNDFMANNFLEHHYEQYFMWLWENTLTYAKTFGLHHLTLLAGITAQDNKHDYMGGSKTDLPNASPNMWYLDAGTRNPTVGGTGSESSMLSYLGRVNYDYNGKYLLTMNFRRDGSSRFGLNNKWGNFPSLALGWKLSEENFFQPLKGTINLLKIRGGWGQIGNEKIGDYAYTTTVNSGTTFVGYVLGNPQTLVAGAAPLSIANEDIKWETTEQTNIGFDAALFRNSLTITADYYIKDTKDMLVAIPVPGNVGLRIDPTINAGSIRNKGLEFSMEFKRKWGNFFYTLGGNFATLKNEVLSLGGGEDIYGAPFFGEFVTRTRVGDPVAAFYGYQTNGIFQNKYELEENVNSEGQVIKQFKAQPGDFRFVNQNNDAVIDQNDKVNIGNPYPSLTYGFYGSAEYKGFDLQFFFQGVHGNKIFNGNKYFTEGTGYYNLGAEMVNAWHGEGTSSTLPNPKGDPANLLVSTRYIEDGSFLRLKNVQFGYTFSENLAQRMGIGSLRIYASATNLLTFTKYTGFDPEIGTGDGLDFGVDRGTYPQPRTFTVGLTLNL